MPLWRTCISQTQITGGKHGWKMFLPYEISAHKANGPLQPERLRALHLFNQSLIKNSKDIASSHPLYTKLIYQSLVKSKNLFLGGGARLAIREKDNITANISSKSHSHGSPFHTFQDAGQPSPS